MKSTFSGITHPFDGFSNSTFDKSNLSVLSYDDYGFLAMDPMPTDISAMQYFYGAQSNQMMMFIFGQITN